MAKINFNLLLVLFFAFIVGVLFWPTLYRYEKSDQSIVRINRFTGNAQVLDSEGWRELSPKVEKAVFDPYSGSKFLSEQEIYEIQGNAGLNGYGYFAGSIYNGTSDSLSEISFEIIAKKYKKVLWKRIYSENFYNFLPSSSQKVMIAISGDEIGLTTEWRVYSASRK